MDLRSPLALVSGGPDSVALLRVVIALGGEPVVLHVDHGQVMVHKDIEAGIRAYQGKLVPA